ncbi:MAG TPA: hypothetical protein VMV27_09315 [Candidatus Binataceae bacterium]|nr:hypothetical protein [Candidatus Binataceae bacterium]
MKRYLFSLLATVAVAAIVIAAMVSGAVAQTMGEYGAATANAGTGAAGGGGQLDTQMPGTVWAGATQFPAGNSGLSDQSRFSESDRFGGAAADSSASNGRFTTGDRFSSSSSLDAQTDRFGSEDRWSQDRWGK